MGHELEAKQANRRLQLPGARAGLSIEWLEGLHDQVIDQTVRLVGVRARN
jgi:hypothetical protein